MVLQVMAADPQMCMMHDAYAAADLLATAVALSGTDVVTCAAADPSKAPPLPYSNGNRSNQRSHSTSRSAAGQPAPPQCIITPANAVSKRSLQLLPHAFQRLSQIQPHTSHASPRPPAEGANPRSRPPRADNAENDFLAHFQSPPSAPMGSQTAQKRRKQKRPQWQDVSIDLGAIQAAQEQAGPTMSHADRPVGPSLSTDTAGAAHMSGVSPASPSPPRQHPQNTLCLQHKPRSSVPTLPALASAGSALPEALAAWHENVRLDQQRHHHQQYQHRLVQCDVDAAEPLPSASGPFRASQQQQSSQAQLPNCLPPLHHQPHVSHPHGLQTSAASAPFQSQHATQVPQYPHMSWFRDQQGTRTPPLSSSHSALQASNDALPFSCNHRAEGPDGFAPGPARQATYEDPRSAQQVPVQYMRHPCGPGASGGLYKLHRLLRPIARSQQRQSARSSSVGEANNAAWDTDAMIELPQHRHETSQQAAAAEPDVLQYPWHAQPSHHDQRSCSVEQQSKPVVVQQQPALQARAAHHTACSGWQEHGVSEQQHQQGMPVDNACHDPGSRDAQGAGDMQDVNMRLQQVLAMCTNKRARWCTACCLASR